MTLTQKKEIITQITDLLNRLIEVEQTESIAQSAATVEKALEILTVKECAALVDSLSEHTVRQLCAQDKIAFVRAGSGVRGKILVSKVSLLRYLGIAG